MPQSTQKCWLTFEGACRDKACLWELSQQVPRVVFDVRQASIGKTIGIMAVQFSADDDELIQDAIEFLESLGVKVDPVEGGSLVAG